MNKRARTSLCTTLMACSLALGPAAAAWAVHAPAAGPSGSACFVVAKAGDATKATVTGGGFLKTRGEVFLDRTDGDDGAGGGATATAAVADDGTFTSGEVPAGTYAVFQHRGPRVACVSGEEAGSVADQKLVLSEGARGTAEGRAQGRKLAESGACDAKAEPRTPNLHGLAADPQARKKAEEAYRNAYSAAFDEAIGFFCHR
ncbi:hypothetical protein [Streptomyces sp. NPDC058157]|uniref:hypothetical protein n=1 Tax=Streptomyces sp. NPDC058157 TaxID=3346360 RepID=UPI0036EA50B0